MTSLCRAVVNMLAQSPTVYQYHINNIVLRLCIMTSRYRVGTADLCNSDSPSCVQLLERQNAALKRVHGHLKVKGRVGTVVLHVVVANGHHSESHFIFFDDVLAQLLHQGGSEFQ